MAGSFKSNDVQIKGILESVSQGSIQLPDFQRGWVWDDWRIRNLIASVSCSYPIGAVMFLEYDGENVRFKYRGLTGADVTSKPELLVLDGQQRITSLFCSMFCKKPVETMTEKKQPIERFYYLDMVKALNPSIDRVDAIVSIPAERIQRTNFDRDVMLDVSSRDKEYACHLFPLNISYDISTCMQWITGYNLHHRDDPHAAERVNQFVDKVLAIIQSYDIPVITIKKSVPKEAVCQVFENVNTGGVSLTVFELVTATFAADDFDLRHDWEKRHEVFAASKILDGVEATDFLSSVTLYINYRRFRADGPALSCKKKDILNISLNDYRAHSESVFIGYRDAEHFLMEQRIFSSRDLPYGTQLIPLAAIFALLGNKASHSSVKSRIARWYWCGVFGEMYGGANETRYALDVLGVLDWIDDDAAIPDTVSRSYFNAARLLSLQTRLSAAYKGVMALILKLGCRDFITSSAMDFTTFIDEGTDIHHIFPRDWCEREKLPKEKWNSIINKTPLFARTNRMIGGHAPSKYLSKIEGTNVPRETVDKNIDSHLINIGAMRSDDFPGHFLHRAKQLVRIIGEATGKPVAGIDSVETVDLFGDVLM